jgi:hypothetical protein
MDATRHNTNHNLGARTTRKTATLSRAERCGQVRVRVSKQVTLLEHASPLVCIVLRQLGLGQPAERVREPERLIANYRELRDRPLSMSISVWR